METLWIEARMAVRSSSSYLRSKSSIQNMWFWWEETMKISESIKSLWFFEVVLTTRYQFEAEVRQKYDAKMYDLITSCYILLPLGTVIGKEVLVVHGGLPKVEKCLLSEIQAYVITDSKQFSHYRLNRKIELPKPQLCKTRELKILEGLLWSDPVEGGGPLNMHLLYRRQILGKRASVDVASIGERRLRRSF